MMPSPSNKPRFSGRSQRGVLAYLLEHGTATDHDMHEPIDSTLLNVRKVVHELRSAGLVQVADTSVRQTKPYGLTHAGIELALAQDMDSPFVFYSPQSPTTTNTPGATP